MAQFHKNIEIRRCLPEDSAPAAALGRSIWGDWANGTPLSRQLIDMGHPVFVARTSSDELVGYCVDLAEADGTTGYVLSITIHSDHRRKGLGAKLAGAVVKDFRDRGMRSVNTVISDDNNSSKELFISLGFRETKKMKNYYEAGYLYRLFNMKFS